MFWSPESEWLGAMWDGFHLESCTNNHSTKLKEFKKHTHIHLSRSNFNFPMCFVGTMQPTQSRIGLLIMSIKTSRNCYPDNQFSVHLPQFQASHSSLVQWSQDLFFLSILLSKISQSTHSLETSRLGRASKDCDKQSALWALTPFPLLSFQANPVLEGVTWGNVHARGSPSFYISNYSFMLPGVIPERRTWSDPKTEAGISMWTEILHF